MYCPLCVRPSVCDVMSPPKPLRQFLVLLGVRRWLECVGSSDFQPCNRRQAIPVYVKVINGPQWNVTRTELRRVRQRSAGDCTVQGAKWIIVVLFTRLVLSTNIRTRRELSWWATNNGGSFDLRRTLRVVGEKPTSDKYWFKCTVPTTW